MLVKIRGVESAYAPFYRYNQENITNTANNIGLESKGEVLYADGQERNLIMLLGHDNNISNLKAVIQFQKDKKW